MYIKKTNTCRYIHTHTHSVHTHMHARMHAHTHTHACTHIHTLIIPFLDNAKLYETKNSLHFFTKNVVKLT